MMADTPLWPLRGEALASSGGSHCRNGSISSLGVNSNLFRCHGWLSGYNFQGDAPCHRFHMLVDKGQDWVESRLRNGRIPGSFRYALLGYARSYDEMSISGLPSRVFNLTNQISNNHFSCSFRLGGILHPEISPF
jgi:hypothetical protein